MDSVFTALHRDALLLDIVDEIWASDCLSDDDIDVPNLGGQQEDNDELNGNLVWILALQMLQLMNAYCRARARRQKVE